MSTMTRQRSSAPVDQVTHVDSNAAGAAAVARRTSVSVTSFGAPAAAIRALPLQADRPGHLLACPTPGRVDHRRLDLHLGEAQAALHDGVVAAGAGRDRRVDQQVRADLAGLA